MSRNLLVFAVIALSAMDSACARAQSDLSPMDIQFRRQGVRRLVFDRDNAIPLSTLNPAEITDLAVEYPEILLSGAKSDYDTASGKLRISADDVSESARWAGGFNPFAAYDVSFEESEGQSVEAGVEFATPDNNNRMMVLAGFRGNECRSVRFQVIVGGKKLHNESVELEKAVRGPFTFRVQMLGDGLNILLEQNGVTRVVGATRFFSNLIDLRRKEYIRAMEFRLLTRLGAGERVVVNHAGAYLTTGFGQADICAMTYEDGSPLLDQGRLWFTISIRGQRAGQGVFSLNPSVFDIRYEGLIVFDRRDGLLRNEIASHIYYDREACQWRGLTVGFSFRGDPAVTIPKQLWAVSSKRDPRFGYSVMKAKALELPGSSEDPHIIYDKQADKWRVLVCTAKKGFAAALYEADMWDGPYKMIAGPVDVDSTGCLLQKIGSQYYAILGSADHKFHVYSYPDLKQLGELDMHRRPWKEGANSRCWPNVIPLPEGYPAPYIALSMDRANYTQQIGWTYGALYLYHGHPKEGERTFYEYGIDN